MSTSLKKLCLTATAVAALLAASGCGVVDQAVMATQLQPGKCIILDGEDPNDLKHKLVDCEPQAETAVYQIITSGQGEQACEADQEMFFTYETDSGEDQTMFSACMMPLFNAGSCYLVTDYDYVEAACEEADFKVLESFDDSDAECTDPAAEPFRFGEGNRAYCLGDPLA